MEELLTDNRIFKERC